jgi:hypothetical protein
MIKHLWTVIKHRHYVFLECCKVELFLQGLLHDLSKFLPDEFFISVKYWTGVATPIGAERLDKGYSSVWMLHPKRNKHHWQYFLDISEDGVIPVDMPEKYIAEMACDMIGASKAYNGKDFNINLPYEFYLKNKDRYIITERSNNLLASYLLEYSTYGKFTRVNT